MQIKANLKMGKSTYQFDIDEAKDMDALHKAIVLTNPLTKCDECGNTEGFYFTSNKDKEGNIYVNVKCPKCGADSKLGQYKSTGFFWKNFVKYIPGTK